MRFILGRAGAGKTCYCLRAIREELKRSQTGEPLLFLVPEQATFEMGRALLREGDLPGYSRAHVLSFRRLAYHVFTEIGGPVLPPAGNVARQMIIARVLDENEDKLQVFKRSARRPGLAARLAALITELHRYRWSREEMETRIAAEDEYSLLTLKLKDILLVYDAYHERLLRDYSDPDDFLDVLAERLPESTFADGAHVWVDGFAGFTPQEYAVLRSLIEKSSQFEMALCLDPAEVASGSISRKNLDPTRLFHQTEETYLAMLSMCKDLGRKVEKTALPRDGQETRFTQRPALDHIERELFTLSPETFSAGADEIEFVEAANPRAEADAAARRILQLCKERNYRYRDIAVIVRDFTGYHELIGACFAEYGISYFIDRRREVTHHPLIELVRSAARAAAEDWPYETVIQYLKSDLAPITREQADAIENYALEHGINGSRWYDGEKWLYRRSHSVEERSQARESDADIEEINRLRESATRALKRFHKRVRGPSHTAKEISTALFDLLRDLKAAEKIDAWRREAEEAGKLDAAAEHAQIWNGLLGMLDEMVDVLGDEEMTMADYVEVLEVGLSGMTLGLVPPALDQVLVGSIDRSRHPDLRAALVIGVGEGILPKVRDEDPIFTDRDREELTGAGLRLGPTSEEQLYHERFLGYIAFTRPKELLWISYPSSDASGKKLNPSIFVNYLKRCLPAIEARHVAATEWRDRLDAVWTKPQLASAAALVFQRGGEGLDDWRSAYNHILARQDERDEKVRRVLASLFYSNAAQRLPARIIDAIYENRTMIGSASQFETFRACPFKYFARYVLKLEPREEFALSALDMGSLYHAVLKRVVSQVIGRGVDLSDLDPAEAMKMVDDAVDELAPNLKSEILLSDGRNEYIRNDSRRVLRDLVAVMLVQAGATDFKPAACELGFGDKEEALPFVELSAGKFKVKIVGRIDRVDIAKGKGARLVRVIDYKSSVGPFALYELVQGLHLQLPTYLIALRELGRRKFGTALTPAGAFLQPIKAGGVTELSLEAAQETPLLRERPAEYKPRGFFGEEFIAHLDRSVQPKEWSRHLVLYMKQDGMPGATGDYVREGQLSRLLELAERHIKDIAEHVIGGETQIIPYRVGTRTACALCDYHGVCRFDATHNRHRDIRRTSRSDLLERLSSSVEELWQEVNPQNGK